ncbi:MAG TPA: Uma2 family endonuclease [Vicinamibacterales bacterium]
MLMANETKRWTLAEVHSLPEDGNKYELIHGELFVTPAPTYQHETILARLTRVLEPYVAANDLGLIYHPRAVFRVRDQIEVEPDLMVRSTHPSSEPSWETAPLPILVVEVASDTTRRRDRLQKRSVYMNASIPDYWIIDGDTRSIRAIRPGEEDVVATDTLTWAPAGAAAPLAIEVARLFD